MSDKDIVTFHQLLGKDSFFLELCEIGKSFEACIQEGRDFPEHLWERKATEALDKLPADELVKLLDPSNRR